MVKKITLKEVGEMLTHVVKHMATKEDVAELRKEMKGDIMATKEQVVALNTQVNSVETQLRGMRYVKLQDRVDNLEVKVFGKVRA